MTIWRSWQTVAVCALLTACNQQSDAARQEIAKLTSRIELLEKQAADDHVRVAELDARTIVAEKNIDTLFSKSASAPAEEAWVAWGKVVPLQQGLLGGRSTPSPEGAYANKATCEENLSEHVKKNGGEPGSLTFKTTDAAGRPAMKVYSCLPKSVDPRG